MVKPIELFYTIVDGDNDKSRIELDIDPTNFTLANAPDVLEFGWNFINPLINGHLLNAGFTVTVDVEAFVSNPAVAAIADVQEKATFALRSVAGFLKHISLPTFIETFFTSSGSGKVVDTSQTAVANIITMFEAGVPVVLVPTDPDDDYAQITDIRGEDIPDGGFVSGVEDWGKRRR